MAAPDAKTREAIIEDARQPPVEPTGIQHLGNSSARWSTFIGRERELQELRDALESALSGQGRLVLLVGEPGIGKTRTAGEIATEAERRGARVVWGSCYEWEGAPPYWPWVQVLNDFTREDDHQLLSELGAEVAELARIVPYLGNRYAIPSRDAHHDASHSRFRLFEAVSVFLKALATQQPLVIVLDDLHWSDEPSLLLLQFLAQEIRSVSALVVGTYRAIDMGWRPKLSQILAEINREPVSQRIMLSGFPKADVVRFITDKIGDKPPSPLVDAVYHETEGNPFFVTEVVRLLASDGPLEPTRAATWRIRVPESVRAVIGRRLDRLSHDCHQVLQIASVLGREFSLSLLEQGFELDRFGLMEALDEALEAQLIESESTIGPYRFSHALVQDTLYQRLPTARRAFLHHRAGLTLKRIHASDPSYYAEVAHHFFQALPAGDARSAVEYTKLAGDRSMSQVAWETAVGHYQRALQALEWFESVDLHQRCELLLSLGSALNRSGPGSGDSPEARRAFQKAADIARELGDAERFARASIGYAGFNTSASFGGPQQVALLEEALILLSTADSPLRVQVLSRLTEDLAILSSGPRPRIRALGNQAVEMARRIGDRSTLALALSARHLGSWGPDNLEERLADASELVALAEQHGHTLSPSWASFWGCINLMLDLVELGDISRANHVMDELEAISEKFRVPYVTLRAVVYRTMFLLMTGRYAEAEPYVERAKQLWQSEMLQQHVFQTFALRREQRRLDELDAEFDRTSRYSARGINRYHHLMSVHRLILLLETDRESEARTLFEALASRKFEDVPRGPSLHGAVALLSEACARLNDVARAETLYNLLIPYAEQIVVLSVNAVCLGSVSHYLGLLATTLSRWEDASRHFTMSLAVNERTGMRPYAAHTRYAHAATLVKRGDREGLREACMRVERALNDANSLGMIRLEREAATLAELLTAAGNAALSRRETDVLRLITDGLTDAEIAEQLGISPRTVNAHVRSVFAKLGVPSRAAATRAAIEQHII